MFFPPTIVSLIRFPKKQTKQMTILPSNIGSNKSPTAKLLTMRNVSHPHQFQHCLTFISFYLCLLCKVNGYISYRMHVYHIPVYNYASFQISQINRRNYFSWLRAHISLGMQQNEQLIFPYLFTDGPAFFMCTIARYLWQPVRSN